MERADNGNLIWQLNETNFADALTKYEYGNGVQVTNVYNDLGSLKRKEMPGVIDFIEYGINHYNGNINTRKYQLPAMAPIQETFTYDNEDRLLSHTYTNATPIETNYDNFGKIDKKDDAGSKYNYNGRNRLLDIENPQNNISTNEQNITYNSFKRLQTINEGDYELTYTYGPDQERIKGEWKDNGSIYRTRIYASNFEINEIVGGPKHEICYISSPNGLCAMYVTDVNAGVGALHYTYTDNLGSIVAVTNETGTVEARQNFDVWGRRRHAITYAYLPQNTPNIHNGLPGISSNGNLPPWLFRGYTGHEMLDEFTLINMNARLYDPVVGMMLSCDNYVSDVTNTQDYHRYCYARNNPLKYVDPDGNEPITLAIAATVGACFGGVSGYKIGQVRGASGWHLLAYTMAGAGIGAAAGVTGAWIGGAAAGGMGAIVGSTLGGASAGAASGAGFYTLGNAGTSNFTGDGLWNATWKGAVSGAAGGFVGASLGGGIDAFAGGGTSSVVNDKLNGSDVNWQNALVSAGISLGLFYGNQAIRYGQYKGMGGSLKFNQWNKISINAQRSFAWKREWGAWYNSEGKIKGVGFGSSDALSSKQMSNKPEWATDFVHTHPPSKDGTFGFPSLEDVYTLRNVNSHTISKEGNYSLPLGDRGRFEPFLKSPNLFTDNIGSFERQYYLIDGPDYYNGQCTDYGSNFYELNYSLTWFRK